MKNINWPWGQKRPFVFRSSDLGCTSRASDTCTIFPCSWRGTPRAQGGSLRERGPRPRTPRSRAEPYQWKTACSHNLWAVECLLNIFRSDSPTEEISWTWKTLLQMISCDYAFSSLLRSESTWLVFWHPDQSLVEQWDTNLRISVSSLLRCSWLRKQCLLRLNVFSLGWRHFEHLWT